MKTVIVAAALVASVLAATAVASTAQAAGNAYRGYWKPGIVTCQLGIADARSLIDSQTTSDKVKQAAEADLTAATERCAQGDETTAQAHLTRIRMAFASE